MGAATTARLVTLGETMGLFRAAETGPGELVDHYHFTTGGAESNVAIGIARLGFASTWIGRVGDDVAGRRILRDLRAEGVTTEAVVDATSPTGLMVKESRVPGSSTVMYARATSAGSTLSAADIDPQTIASAQIVHVTGITPGLSSAASLAVDHALDLAVDAGVDVSFDVNHRSRIWRQRDPREVYRRIAARSHIVFAGHDEATLLVGEGTPRELAARISELGPPTVVIKLGATGAIALSGNQYLSVPAMPITAVDTVGAGDAFVAGYLAELLRGAPLDERLETARRAGAFACLGLGDWEHLPRTRELGILDHRDPVTR